MNTRILFLLFLPAGIWLLAGCKKNNSNPACDTIGQVEDFTGLDGCGLMIVTEKGEKLLPAKITVPGLELRAGQKARFGYRKLEDRMGICMAQDAFVEITCWSPLEEDKPVYKECLDFERLPESGWIVDLVARLRPVRITKYAFRTNGWAYLFSGEKPVLYDCQGTLICESKEPDAKDCLQLVEPGAKGRVIFEKP